MANAKVSFNGTTLIDLTDATATADKILDGYTAYGSTGEKLLGTATPSTPTIEALSVTENGTYTAPSGVDGYSPITVNVPGIVPTGSQTFTNNGTYDVTSLAEAVINVAGGGGGIGTLLATKALGTLSTTSTSTVDLEQKLTIPNAVDYDLIITEVSVDTPTNNRHLATVSLVYMTASSDIATRNGVADISRFLIFKLTSNGAPQSRQNTTGYGVFTRVSSASIIDGTINLAIGMRYNSTTSGTIDGDYTARAYGVNLYDLIGG